MSTRKRTEQPQPRLSKKELIQNILTRTPRKKFLTDSQRHYYEMLEKNEITICSGPAGVGKSYIAMNAAINLLMDPNNSYEKLIIVRPAVEAEEKLGSLPGNVEEKLEVVGVIRSYNSGVYTNYAHNYLRAYPSGAYFFDHATVGQSFIWRVSNASSLDNT